MPSTQDPLHQYDVVIVGYGPTGMVLAPLLAQRGWSVAVLERYSGLYNLPRAATFDDETMRIFQKLGISDVVSAGTRPLYVYDWTNGDGQVLARHTFAERGISGWPEFNMMYQPWLEDRLDELGRSLPGIDVLYEHRVTALHEVGDGVVLDVETSAGSASIGGRFVVACDGGNSTIRRLLDIDSDDLGFFEPWLVCDFLLKRPVANLPAALQLGDPAQPVSIFTIDDEHQRFAFMLDDPRQIDEITEADVWQKVSRWLGPDDADPIRVATYTFRSRIAQMWRSGRVFLAGDAAHEMPPFLGQGMCSGIRDANNLAWKLDLVLSDRADERLLDTYARERAPHVEKITSRAIELGRLQTIRDVERARARDERMLKARAESGEPAAYAFPGYDDGFLAESVIADGRGMLLPQGSVGSADGTVHRLDDLFGPGFQLVATDKAALPPAAEARQRWGVDVFTIAGAENEEKGADSSVELLVDLDGVYHSWFADQGCAAVLVRPDRYIFGAARSLDEVNALVAELVERTAHARDPQLS